MALNIKDGNGSAATLKTSLDSGDLVPHHIVDGTVNVTSSLANPVAITGTVLTVTPPVTTVTNNVITSYDWSTSESGTFALASNDTSRKGLTIFNPGPNNLYISLSTAGGSTNGFTLVDTASAPSVYTTVIFPSGTYIADQTTVGVYHGGYFISGTINQSVFATSIS